MAKFQPGQPRPPGSGSKKGQRYKKTIDREQAVVELRKETNEIMSRYTNADMTGADILNDMGFEPLVYAALMVQKADLKPADQIKLLEMLVATKHAKRKAVEHTGNQTIHTIQVVMPGMEGYDDDQYIDVDARPLIEHEQVDLVEPSEDDPQ